jgi:monooxygenase
MSTTTHQSQSTNTNHVDVLIVGAGISGIASAYHIQKRTNKTFAILEGRAVLGGTWDLFKYPGIRSDSDMQTFGFSFFPWTDPNAISSAPAILDYLHRTVEEFNLARHIRYQHRVTGASWSSEQALWTVDVAIDEGDTAHHKQMTCRFLHMCTGYYDYDAGYTPHFEGREDFTGRIVHPQHWDETLDYTDKRVVVIGSGATAVTLVPNMAECAQHVTMLQRSPTYIVSRPAQDAVVKWLHRLLPSGIAHNIARWRSILRQMFEYWITQRFPDVAKKNILQMAQDELGDAVDAKHLTPTYNPWEQRLCLIPDSDLWNAIKAGKASIVTDDIERFVPEGIRLQSGDVLPADVIVTATGLSVKIMKGVDILVDGETFNLSQTLSYKGLMFGNLPNLAQTFGYINASWTLRAELIAEFVCRVLNHMDATHNDIVMPALPDVNWDETRTAVDLKSGYIRRVAHELPKQGMAPPWTVSNYYVRDMMTMRYGKLEDGVLQWRKKEREAIPI